MSSLRLESIRKVFGDPNEGEIVAVDDVSMEIEDGEFMVLVGPSGSGKSTLLRLISGLETLTNGNLYLGDEEIGRTKPKNRDLAMVFQNYALYPHLTARGNMSFGLKMQGELDETEIAERVDDAADIMDIGHLLEKMPSELSGGQQQRVALGRAIVRNPEVFLMDEPLSNLDAKLRSQMRTEIQRLQSDLGVTTIYVTHDQTEAMTMGDRIAIMNHGELQQVATPLEAYYEPANVFVAGFIGSPSMNFIPATTDTSADRLTLEHDAFSYGASSVLGDELTADGREILVGIRPEDFDIVQSPTDTSVTVEIDVIEPLGKEHLLYFDIGQETYTASIPGYVQVEAGDRIHLEIPEQRIHVFDAESRRTIKNREPASADEAHPNGQLTIEDR
ncbi:ABC transporter ATP-binding protein [Halosolutus gelatinilyticus]|uniref:ABC transporter ATP-binding protein n=1 Tax=Halosolutus gelatinilyticus TaxID=2931975 RepID=UPI001FF2BB22|nr:sn-glycerol-3-phosphate ABC transporter ATP-binding protein UgpC [Halosolutus gelatinilyticus]